VDTDCVYLEMLSRNYAKSVWMRIFFFFLFFHLSCFSREKKSVRCWTRKRIWKLSLTAGQCRMTRGT